MSVEFIGIARTADASETATEVGAAVQPDYLYRIARAHERSGFDRVLVTQTLGHAGRIRGGGPGAQRDEQARGAARPPPRLRRPDGRGAHVRHPRCPASGARRPAREHRRRGRRPGAGRRLRGQGGQVPADGRVPRRREAGAGARGCRSTTQASSTRSPAPGRPSGLLAGACRCTSPARRKTRSGWADGMPTSTRSGVSRSTASGS